MTTFTYDGFNRRSSSTDPLGYQLLFSYDAGDRLAAIKYPDGTSTSNAYHFLDLASTTDSLNRTTRHTYDALERRIQTTDPLGRIIKYGYCSCGALNQLTDGNGNTSRWSYDDEDRPLERTFADGSKITYNYENTTSRLRRITDALNQVTVFTYNLDDTVKRVTYMNAVNPTPAINFTYDPGYVRLRTMTDGTGTTVFTYYPILSPPAQGMGRLARISGPQGDVISLTYDALGRPAMQTVDGSVDTLSFDSIGRLITEKNVLDTFNIAYMGGSSLPLSVKSASTNGFDALFSYFGHPGNDLLKTIANQFHKGVAITPISSFQYAYDADEEITSTMIQKPPAAAITRATAYDAAGQLLSLTASAGGGSNYLFGYDKAANRISERVGATTTTFTYNNVNALTAPVPAIYDKDGEPLTLGGRSFRWDAGNRLISVTSGANTTKFAYDALNRRTRITKLVSDAVVSDKFYFWWGDNLLLETDALNHNAVTKRYFSEGVIQNGIPLYYAIDKLGSIRELVDTAGVVQARYDYDPYGVRSRLMGAQDSDLGFAGLFHESQSGLDLAEFRAYDAPFRRWLNRDPIVEFGGVNLYAYSGNNPQNLTDPSGLSPGWSDVWEAIKNFLITFATKDSPVPLPLTSPEDAPNTYNGGYQAVKKYLTNKIYYNDPHGKDKDFEKLRQDMEKIDDMNVKVGCKEEALKALLKKNHSVIVRLK